MTSPMGQKVACIYENFGYHDSLRGEVALVLSLLTFLSPRTKIHLGAHTCVHTWVFVVH